MTMCGNAGGDFRRFYQNGSLHNFVCLEGTFEVLPSRKFWSYIISFGPSCLELSQPQKLVSRRVDIEPPEWPVQIRNGLCWRGALEAFQQIAKLELQDHYATVVFEAYVETDFLFMQQAGQKRS